VLPAIVNEQVPNMYVIDLAKQTGAAPDTIRYYTKIGLLQQEFINRSRRRNCR